MRAIAEGCRDCEEVGATASNTVRARAGDKEVTDVNLYGQTANMADIDTRNGEVGRYFTPSEVEHHTDVCVIGDTMVQRLFLWVEPVGIKIRLGNDELVVIGGKEKVGTRLGRDEDHMAM